MLSLKRNYASLAFPDIHKRAQADVALVRTLRVPDDGKEYPLPPGLGNFPVMPTEETRAPEEWKQSNAGVIPMWPSEALWIDFSLNSYPCAIKVAVGGINAITGEALTTTLTDNQDYVVSPDQPWLDGALISNGVVRQFIAGPVGLGHSIAEQLGGDGFTSIEMLFFPMTAESYEWRLANMARATGRPKPLQLCAGGKIRQRVYQDRHGLDAWLAQPAGKLNLYLVPATVWRRLTGNRPPARAPKAVDYTNAGLSWFDYYDPLQRSLPAKPKVKTLRSAKAGPQEASFSVPQAQIKTLGRLKPASV